MRVAVIGAGAIGAVVADAAVRSGHEVVVCTRSPIKSLALATDGPDRPIEATLTADPGDPKLAPADVVWVTVKATDTAGAGPWLSRLCGAHTLIASSQNGLDHESRLAPFVPAGRIVPALAYIAAERLEPGRVRYLAGNRIIAPEGPHLQLEEAVGEGGLVVRGVSDMLTACWRKLLGNLVANPITALTMRRIGVMREPGIAEVARGLLAEAVLVGRAEGAQLLEDDVESVVAATTQYGEQTGSSMLYDRLAGRPLEHQFLTGEVVTRGLQHGIPVPMNFAILALLEAIDRGREPGDGS